jgi:hypothetical protein
MEEVLLRTPKLAVQQQLKFGIILHLQFPQLRIPRELLGNGHVLEQKQLGKPLIAMEQPVLLIQHILLGQNGNLLVIMRQK